MINHIKCFVVGLFFCGVLGQAQGDVLFEWDDENSGSVSSIAIFDKSKLLGTITRGGSLAIIVPKKWHDMESSFFLQPDLEGYGKVGRVEFYAALSKARYKLLVRANKVKNQLDFSIRAVESGEPMIYGTQKVPLKNMIFRADKREEEKKKTKGK
ncbi:MAG: hypothetical protein GY915_09685 [bacterium]|nr:hypothetical protein [bacterium]